MREYVIHVLDWAQHAQRDCVSVLDNTYESCVSQERQTAARSYDATKL